MTAGLKSLPDRTAPRAADHDARLAELSQIIDAYNQVTIKLQQSHDTLTAEVQRLQKDLASANVALQRSKRLAALGEMAAGIAHEIRNPLASIQLYANMLQTDLADRPAEAKTVCKIAEAVRGLNAIVCDVLVYARQMTVRCVEGDAASIFDRVIETMRPMIAASGIDVIVDSHAATVTVRHDPDLLHRAMLNLVRNALEAMPDGGTLTLAADHDDEAAILTVADTGPGISDEAIDRIFNPFFTTRHTGTGLGLAIVHRIIDAHGGSIGVHNDLKTGGAVFTLTLPAEADHAPSDEELHG